MDVLTVRGQRVVMGVLIVLAAGLAGCESMGNMLNLQKPGAKIVGVRFKDLSFTSVTMLFDVEVENPYSVPLPLMNMDYSLASNDEPFLTGEGELQGAVPAGGKKTFPLSVKVIYLKLFNVVKDIRPGSDVPYQAELGLSVKLPVGKPLRLPLRKEGKLPTPRLRVERPLRHDPPCGEAVAVLRRTDPWAQRAPGSPPSRDGPCRARERSDGGEAQP